MKDWFLKGAGFHALRAACSLIRADIVIPEVVRDELLANYRRELKNAIVARAKLSREVIDVAAALEADYGRYLGFIEELEHERVVLRRQYPLVSHKDVVERIYAEKRPFKNAEIGYKDYLIWRTVAELLSEPDVQGWRTINIAFISANKSDFASKDESPLELHRDFLNDLSEAERQRLSFFDSTDSYSRSVIGDGFAQLARHHPDAANELRANSLPRILNTFLTLNRPHKHWKQYDATDLTFTISHVGKLPEDNLFSISGIMDFTPWWYHPSDGMLIGTNYWDADVALVADSDLHVLKADIDGESVDLT
jgi:hypothetical protein